LAPARSDETDSKEGGQGQEAPPSVRMQGKVGAAGTDELSYLVRIP
jgi:hypothetical protein